MVLWINVNERLHNGISLINALGTVKFELLLSHIVKNIESDEIFSEQELKKLQESLKFTAENMQLLVQSVTYIFKQSSKVILKPTVLIKQLTEDLKFDQEKAEKFVKIWSETTNKELGDFTEHKKLENISWELNLQTATSLCTKQNIPNARVHLDLSSNKENFEKISLDLSEHDVLRLYNTFETIQSKLDVINKKQ